MDGAVTVKSAPGAGTTFTAVIRLARDPESASADAGPAAERTQLAGSVLIAEDSPVNRELALRQLRRLGVRAAAVDSGTAAVAALEGESYDVVLMDMRMPGMDGLEATREIRMREGAAGRRRTPIIAVTANAMHGDRAACLEAGMDDFATKPLVLDDLAAALGRWLQRVPAGPPAPGPPPTRAPGDEEHRIREKLTSLADELGSLDGARRVIDAWLSEMPGRLRDAKESSRAGDAGRLRDVAHALKGTLGLVDATSAAAVAAEVERHAAGDAMQESEVTRLLTAAERVQTVVRGWYQESGSQE
jgi:two-component system sensor histidine kinase/response regulator